ncbi:MAG: ATP phosphoribosyltransferase regulatory subunit [Thermoleophilia bacterium]
MTVLRTPPGTKDVLPTEAAEIRLIEDAVRTVFHEFAYGEVLTPALEYEEVLALSEEKAFLTGFRLLDESGRVLILRPDLTTPIARLVGSRLRAGETPHRLFSVSDVFRSNAPQRGQESEFRQAGVELLGLAQPEADGEVLAVTCRALERAGLEDYRVGVGQVAFFKGLLDAATGDTALKARLTDDLVDKDLVGYRLAVERSGLDDEACRALLEVPDLRGGPEVLDRAAGYVRGPHMQAALDHLAAVSSAVSAYGYGERLLFDLGIFRNLDYYTGVVFEVYAPGVGFTLGGGGRYDALLAAYGAPMPAVGLGLGLDRIHVALVEQGRTPEPHEPLVLFAGGLDEHVMVADLLRAACVGVFALPASTTAETGARLARQKEIPIFVEPVAGTGGSRWMVTDFRGSGLTEACALADLPAVVCHAAFDHEDRS